MNIIPSHFEMNMNMDNLKTDVFFLLPPPSSRTTMKDQKLACRFHAINAWCDKCPRRKNNVDDFHTHTQC